jgi:DNA topoisomerase-1
VLDQVRAQIQAGLADPDNPKRNMIATACYLIDALCLRVGDEKDEDEADTVGATTLRPEHVTLYPDGTAEFRFLGKDSVLWHRRIPMPPLVHQRLGELMQAAEAPGNNAGNEEKPQLFPLVSSRNVNAFFSSILEGLTGKVFRTHHATEVVRESLEQAQITAEDPEYKKWGAVVQANLAAAELCNHTKQAPKNWPARLARMQEREKVLQERVELRQAQLQERQDELQALPQQKEEKLATCRTDKQRERAEISFQKKTARAERRVEVAQGRLDKAKAMLGKLQTQMAINSERRAWNLGTSLKSYIDPRVYYRWGQEVDYDVLERYYPKTLRRKFAWVKEE